MIVEGKVKTVFDTENPEEVLIEYHDKVTAGNGEKEDYPAGKGSLCCQISSILFDKLEFLGIIFLALFVDGFFRVIGMIPPFMGIDVNILHEVIDRVKEEVFRVLPS